MAKWLVPVLLVAVGACVCVVGLLYGVLAVGVPTPDAPPAVAAREAMDADLAFVLVAAGLAVVALGMLGGAVVGAAWVIRRRAPGAEVTAAPDRARAGGGGRSRDDGSPQHEAPPA